MREQQIIENVRQLISYEDEIENIQICKIPLVLKKLKELNINSIEAKRHGIDEIFTKYKITL